MKNYDKFLVRARKSGVKSHFLGAIGFACLNFVIFGYYAYAFYAGSWLI